MPYSPSKTKFGTQQFGATTGPADGAGGSPQSQAALQAQAQAAAQQQSSPLSARDGHHRSQSLAAAGAAMTAAAGGAPAGVGAAGAAAAGGDADYGYGYDGAAQQPPNWPTASILPHKAGVDPLERQRREDERRRARFEERRVRILNVKTRVIGVDRTALDAQVKEKEALKQKVANEKQYFDQLTLSHAKLLSEVERERQRVRASRDEQLAFYRKQQEMTTAKRKADDRLAAQSNQPLQHPLDATAAGGKPNTVFLDFAGEDLAKAARETEQKRQQQMWLEQHLTAANAKAAAQRQEEADYAAQDKRINDLKKQTEGEAQAARATMRKHTQHYNQLQSAAGKKSTAATAAADAAAKAAEIAHTLHSDILNEKQSADALRTNFKGFSSGQRQQIASEQQRQISELNAKRAAEAQAEADYAAMQEQVQRELIRGEQRKADHARTQRVALAQTHQHQHKEHLSAQRKLNKEVYTNPVAPAFFDQFGTSHR